MKGRRALRRPLVAADGRGRCGAPWWPQRAPVLPPAHLDVHARLLGPRNVLLTSSARPTSVESKNAPKIRDGVSRSGAPNPSDLN